MYSYSIPKVHALLLLHSSRFILKYHRCVCIVVNPTKFWAGQGPPTRSTAGTWHRYSFENTPAQFHGSWPEDNPAWPLNCAGVGVDFWSRVQKKWTFLSSSQCDAVALWLGTYQGKLRPIYSAWREVLLHESMVTRVIKVLLSPAGGEEDSSQSKLLINSRVEHRDQGKLSNGTRAEVLSVRPSTILPVTE